MWDKSLIIRSFLTCLSVRQVYLPVHPVSGQVGLPTKGR